MKRLLTIFASMLITSAASAAFAVTPEEKNTFVNKYKEAFEAKDEATLESFLYTKGADPEALEFFKMMITADMGSKISEIKLVALTPEELKDAAAKKPGITGGESVMPVKPTMKLVLKINTSGQSGSSSSTSQALVAEVDGKLVIPVPVAVK